VETLDIQLLSGFGQYVVSVPKSLYHALHLQQGNAVFKASWSHLQREWCDLDGFRNHLREQYHHSSAKFQEWLIVVGFSVVHTGSGCISLRVLTLLGLCTNALYSCESSQCILFVALICWFGHYLEAPWGILLENCQSNSCSNLDLAHRGLTSWSM
jgi:hypothetical protein